MTRISTRIAVGALLTSLLSTVVAPAALADPGAVSPDQRFLADIMSYMIPPWPGGETSQLGHRVCADMATGVTADAERNAIVDDLLRRNILASNADVGTMVHFAVQDLCPQIPYR
jgi:hypothetical protein